MTTTIADSIAVKILQNDSILTGVGNELHWYRKSKGGKSLEKHVLETKLQNKIHGIEHNQDTGDSLLLIYGEKEFVLLEKSNDTFNEVCRAYLSDWISGAHFLKHPGHFVLLTAHSVVLKYKYLNGRLEKDIKASCVDKSTLYCGSLYGSEWSNLLVFGGNAFGELLIWQPSDGSLTKYPNKTPLLHRIPAHNGVIFSICYDHQSKLLTTTSDDRSIRFWNIKMNNDNWKEAQVEPFVSGYGHIARVFQGKIIKNGKDIFVITVGEDSYFCIWRHDGSLLFKKRHQFGAVIWQFDYDPSTKTLVTVGSTGNLLSFNLKSIFEGEKHNSTTILPSLQTQKPDLCHYMAKIKFVGDHFLVGITNANQFVYLKCEKDNQWSMLQEFPQFKVTVLEVYDNLIALCGYKRLMIYKLTIKENNERPRFELLVDKQLLDGIIRAFQFLNLDTYLVSDEAGKCQLLRFNKANLESYDIHLPKCKEKWLTSALLMEDTYLVVSNRLGNLMLYVYCLDQDNFVLRDTLKHPHGNLGATLLTKVREDENFFVIQTAGHDGSLKFIQIDRHSQSLRILKRESIPISWVEVVIKPQGFDDDVLMGFNDNHFVAWSKAKDFLIQLPCGGGHRCWHFQLSEANTLSLVFIRNKQVLLDKQKLSHSLEEDIQLPKPHNWHVRPCNIAHLISNNKQNYIISAGEDNLVKISQWEEKTQVVRQISEIHSHISNVRALCIKETPSSSSDFLVFSAGGRAQLCISQFNSESQQTEEVLSFMLTDRENHSKPYNFDPETRLMSIDTFFDIEKQSYCIYLACSDGFLRLLTWKPGEKPVLVKEFFYGKCLLQVRLVIHNEQHQYVLAAATDGLINFFDLNLANKQKQLPHHQSGINALDIFCDAKENALHLLSGGDDQAVAYSKLDLHTLNVLHSWHLPYLHTAQVTAAHFAKDDTDSLLAFTSGIDQNVFKLDPPNGEVLAEFHSCVADVKGLCVDAEGFCYVYGCGVQIFKI